MTSFGENISCTGVTDYIITAAVGGITPQSEIPEVLSDQQNLSPIMSSPCPNMSPSGPKRGIPSPPPPKVAPPLPPCRGMHGLNGSFVSEHDSQLTFIRNPEVLGTHDANAHITLDMGPVDEKESDDHSGASGPNSDTIFGSDASSIVLRGTNGGNNVDGP